MKTRKVCPTCNQQGAYSEKFCTVDGSKLIEVRIDSCRYCDSILGSRDKFCGGCGAGRDIALPPA